MLGSSSTNINTPHDDSAIINDENVDIYFSNNFDEEEDNLSLCIEASQMTSYPEDDDDIASTTTTTPQSEKPVNDNLNKLELAIEDTQPTQVFEQEKLRTTISCDKENEMTLDTTTTQLLQIQPTPSDDNTQKSSKEDSEPLPQQLVSEELLQPTPDDTFATAVNENSLEDTQVLDWNNSKNTLSPTALLEETQQWGCDDDDETDVLPMPVVKDDTEFQATTDNTEVSNVVPPLVVENTDVVVQPPPTIVTSNNENRMMTEELDIPDLDDTETQEAVPVTMDVEPSTNQTSSSTAIAPTVLRQVPVNKIKGHSPVTVVASQGTEPPPTGSTTCNENKTSTTSSSAVLVDTTKAPSVPVLKESSVAPTPPEKASSPSSIASKVVENQGSSSILSPTVLPDTCAVSSNESRVPTETASARKRRLFLIPTVAPTLAAPSKMKLPERISHKITRSFNSSHAKAFEKIANKDPRVEKNNVQKRESQIAVPNFTKGLLLPSSKRLKTMTAETSNNASKLRLPTTSTTTVKQLATASTLEMKEDQVLSLNNDIAANSEMDTQEDVVIKRNTSVPDRVVLDSTQDSSSSQYGSTGTPVTKIPAPITVSTASGKKSHLVRRRKGQKSAKKPAVLSSFFDNFVGQDDEEDNNTQRSIFPLEEKSENDGAAAVNDLVKVASSFVKSATITNDTDAASPDKECPPQSNDIPSPNVDHVIKRTESSPVVAATTKSNSEEDNIMIITDSPQDTVQSPLSGTKRTIATPGSCTDTSPPTKRRGRPRKKSLTTPKSVRRTSCSSAKKKVATCENIFNYEYTFVLTGFKTTEIKDRIGQYIEAYGGVVLPTLVGYKKKDDTNVILIAPVTATRRESFLIALSLDIPIVHPDWLSAVLRVRSVLPVKPYLIPVGCCSGYPVDAIKNLESPSLDLRDLKIAIGRDIVGGMRSLITQVLTNCNAEIVSDTRNKKSLTLSYIDLHNDDKILSIHPEWLWACLVTKQRQVMLQYIVRSTDDCDLKRRSVLSDDNRLCFTVGSVVKLDDNRFYVVTKVLPNSVAIKRVGTNFTSCDYKKRRQLRLLDAETELMVRVSRVKSRVIVVAEEDLNELEYIDPCIFTL